MRIHIWPNCIQLCTNSYRGIAKLLIAKLLFPKFLIAKLVYINLQIAKLVSARMNK